MEQLASGEASLLNKVFSIIKDNKFAAVVISVAALVAALQTIGGGYRQFVDYFFPRNKIPRIEATVNGIVPNDERYKAELLGENESFVRQIEKNDGKRIFLDLDIFYDANYRGEFCPSDPRMDYLGDIISEAVSVHFLPTEKCNAYFVIETEEAHSELGYAGGISSDNYKGIFFVRSKVVDGRSFATVYKLKEEKNVPFEYTNP